MIKKNNEKLFFRGIFELIELIKTDLANYELSVNREAIEEYSAKLEFDDFNKMLKNNPCKSRGKDFSKIYKSINLFDFS